MKHTVSGSKIVLFSLYRVVLFCDRFILAIVRLKLLYIFYKSGSFKLSTDQLRFVHHASKAMQYR